MGMSENSQPSCAQFDLTAVAAGFPEQAESLLLDRYLVDHSTASARVFRVYRPTPAHFHRLSDEHLYVLSGTGTVWLGDPSRVGPFGPGTFLFFPRETVHAMPELGEEPVVFLAIDTPRRHPEDIVFVEDAQENTPASFIQPVSEGSGHHRMAKAAG
jgi:mannose-6-phosphate isomerase-like protein (cupin superfamily)